MNKFDPKKFQFNNALIGDNHTHLYQERKVEGTKRRQFLKGPISLPWLMRASRLPGRAIVVGIVIWFRVGLCKSKTITLTTTILSNFGVDRHAKRRSLEALEMAGLVSVVRCSGKNPTITVIEVQE